LAKTNYKYEKRKRELAKQRKKAEKHKLKQIKKDTGSEETQDTPVTSDEAQETPVTSEDSPKTPPVEPNEN